MKTKTKVVVIGAVAGGLSCAMKLKRNLKDEVDIIVYEASDMISYGSCGIPYYVGDKIIEVETLNAKSVDQVISSGIDLKINHEVINVDALTKEVQVNNLDTKTIITMSYDYLVVASGAKPRIFAPLSTSYHNVFSVRTPLDAKNIKDLIQNNTIKKAAVIGAGYIGLEMVEALAHYGIEITLIEASNQILNVLDSDLMDQVYKVLDTNHINYFEQASLIDVELQENNISKLMIKVNDEIFEKNVDLVINCAGIAPATSFIEGIEKASNGAIIVDEKMQSSNEFIYAAGDCTIMKNYISNELQYAPLGTNANKQGRIIADLLSNIKPKPFKFIGASAIKLFDIDVARVGLNENDAIRLKLDYKTNTINGNSYASYYGSEILTMKIIYDVKTRLILGVEAVGQGIVVARVNYYAIAINAGLSVDDMSMQDLCYSPPFSGVWDTALILSNTIK